jgi:hypothetical protein
LGSALLYISAGTAGLLCALLSIVAATLYVLVFVLASAGELDIGKLDDFSVVRKDLTM